MASDPYVFLHVTQPGRIEPVRHGRRVGDANLAALQRLIAVGAYTEVRPPALYLYRLRYRGHTQVAVVGDIDLGGWASGEILPHERIRPRRTAVMAEHLDQVGMSGSPVALAYRDVPAVSDVVERVVVSERPVLHFHRSDDLDQTVWLVPDGLGADLQAAFAGTRYYIVDGHHRVGAALEVARRRPVRQDIAETTAAPPRLMAALFPASQLRSHAFHRLVADLGGLAPEALVEQVGAAGFEVTALDPSSDPMPRRPGRFAMYVGGHWYAVERRTVQPSEVDPTVLQRRILGPILGIDEASAGGRLDHVPGVDAPSLLVERVDRSGGVAFMLCPVPIAQVMAVADAGRTLPPKSTYFDPKVRSGVFIRPS